MESTLTDRVSLEGPLLRPSAEGSPGVALSHPPRSFGFTLARHVFALLLALSIGAGCLWLYTRGNGFPSRYYHPDEYGKAWQLMGRWDFNFNHPLLLLDVADRGIDWFKVPRSDEYQVTVMGRWASATLASLGVAAVCLAGYASYGFVGLFLTGAIVALCPALLINAHFFKEDASLLCGIMIAMLGARYTLSAKRVWSQLLAALVLGFGCGAAASGKYVGAITIIPALLSIFISRMQNWYALPARTLVFCLTLLVTIHTINRQAFQAWNSFALTPDAAEGFYSETHHAADAGHYGLALSQPNDYWWRIASTDVLLPLWILGGAGLIWMIARKRFTRWEATLLAFIVTYAIVLSFNKIPMARYALPVSVGLYVLIAQFVSGAVVDLSKKSKIAGLAGLIACLGVVTIVQGTWARDLTDRFNHDTRQDFRDYVAANVPANAVIVCDNHSGLTSPGDSVRYPDQPRLPQRLIRDSFRNVPDYAPTLEAMKLRGVTHVAVANLNFDRFFDPQVSGIVGQEDWFKGQRKFYEDLFSRGTLVWHSDPKHATHAWVDIDLRLYDIRTLKPAGPGGS